ncbi:6-hydroxymethylpterin diphosphokinase MptE-like protein [Cyanothece sp. BG0011]|uniref:6-hydroxymethylpterin diphosphokinase MptE-like protein n=1 Tax=Cyanothece sp. BG0011 TaxID=2082950 RepID=UPI000D1F91F5|nr:6-hydroxymethylpterin diphosphokinase MptE-like protein [Cyanothece sp. BG0011]
MPNQTRQKLKKRIIKYLSSYEHNLATLRYGLSTESSKWKKLKNKYAGQRCFILGNGPSLKKQNLLTLKNEVTFVANWFALHENCQAIKPTFYCICAHEIFGTNTKAYLRWEKEVNFDEKLYDLISKKAENSIKVFPIFFKEGIENKNLFEGQEVRYLFYEPPVKGIHKVGSMNLDIAKQRLHSGETVILNFCLPIAYYLGFKEIYLLGCDCDYGIQKPTDSRQYFYQSQEQTGDAPPFDWLQRSWSTDGPMISSYVVARKEFEKTGRTIYNATAGGKLEVFPRVDFNEIIKTS